MGEKEDWTIAVVLGPKKQFYRWRRRATFESLEARAVPAGLPFQVSLDVEARRITADAGFLPDGSVRIVGSASSGADGTAWDFDAAGKRLNERALPELPEPGRKTSAAAISPNGRWIAGPQYDFDNQDPYAPALGLWDGNDVASLVRIDIAALPYMSGQAVDVANNGDVLISGANYSGYRWSAAGGFVALEAVEISGVEEWWPAETRVSAISADGSVIVGASSRGLVTVPTIWTSAGPQALAANGRNGMAVSVSDDGRIVGGYLTVDNEQVAVVWVDGVLRTVDGEDGQAIEGSVGSVIGGLGSTGEGWIAFVHGKPESPYGPGETWIAFSGGGIQPLDEWLLEHYAILLTPGLEMVVTIPPSNQLLAATVVDGDLRMIFVGQMTLGFAGWSPMTAPTAPQLVVAPLNAAGEAIAEHPLDVNGNGSISASDALIVINVLNEGHSGPLSEYPDIVAEWPRIDVNQDGAITASDALTIINFLTRATPVFSPLVLADRNVTRDEGEGEPPSMSATDLTFASAADELFAGLGGQRRKK